jgi:hypothetical protein
MVKRLHSVLRPEYIHMTECYGLMGNMMMMMI